jgi:hypothetical protein
MKKKHFRLKSDDYDDDDDDEDLFRKVHFLLLTQKISLF